MNFFTAGDFIILGIVAIVLFVFRQMDKDNRSLEKVKKYADKLKEDLELFVSERGQAIKDYAIELDVQQKSAKELLGRIHEVETELHSKSEEISLIDKRISDYDRTLDELLSMTERADENLKRIREESAYADQIAKKITDVKNHLDALENKIPQIQGAFHKANSESLETLKTALLTEIDANLKEADAHAERTGSLAREHEKRAQESLASLQSLIQNAFESARTEAVKLEDQAFGKLKESIMARSDKLKEALEEKYQTLQIQAKEKVIETQSLVKNFKAEWIEDSKLLISDFNSDLEKETQKLEERITISESRVEMAEKLYDERFEKVEKKGLELVASVSEKVKDAVQKYKDDSALKIQDLKSTIQSFVQESKNTFTENERDAKSRLETLDSKIEAIESAFKEKVMHIDTRSKEIAEKVLQEVQKSTDGRADTIKKALEAEFAMLTKDIHEKEAEIKKVIERLSKETEAWQKNVDSSLNTSSLALSKAEEKLTLESKQLEAKILESVSILKDQFSKDTNAAQTKIAFDLEKQLADFKNDASYKFQKLEEVNTDISLMESTLRSIMKDIEMRIESDFKSFGDNMHVKQKENEVRLETEMLSLHKSMDELDQNLADLKGKAYANVSEKLKLFEDDFFQDLNKRAVSIDDTLNTFKSDLDKKLITLAETEEEERVRIEKTYFESLKARLSETETKLLDQLERISSQSIDYQNTIKELQSENEISIKSFQAAVKQDFQVARDQSDAAMQAEFQRYQLAQAEIIKKSERELDVKIKTLNEGIDASRNDALAAMEALRSDIVVWQEKSQSKIRDTQTDTQEQLTIVNTEITSTKEDIARLRQELTQKTASALESFGRSYENLIQDVQKKSSEIQTDADVKTRELKVVAQDMKEKVEAAQAKLFVRIEDQVHVLSVQMEEIDKRLKMFSSQTKIFERADELKVQLEHNIEDLKTEISKVQSHRSEVNELEQQFGKIKRLEDDVNQKMTKFMGEKKRIEAMEEDFKKLIVISQAVDSKLSSFTESDDILTDMQVRMKKLQDLSNEAENKYERLEKKSNVMTATTEAVDRNFKSIQTIETAVRTVESELKNLPDRVIDLKRSIETIMQNRTQIDDTMKKLSTLDDVLLDIDKKTEEAVKARDWIARTETRLEEIAREAKEQVALLGDIMKTETKGQSKGSPALSTRETVGKLSRQGWSVEEISRATKLSRGEVELILEVNTRE